jgi:uncharacterized protein (TIGR00251 family)
MKCIISQQDNTLALNVYVQPRASQNRVAGMHGNAVKICVTAPPVENNANEAVIHFIAKLLGVSKSSLSIKSGRQARNKKIIISNLALQDAHEALARALAKT